MVEKTFFLSLFISTFILQCENVNSVSLKMRLKMLNIGKISAEGGPAPPRSSLLSNEGLRPSFDNRSELSRIMAQSLLVSDFYMAHESHVCLWGLEFRDRLFV